MTDLPTTHVHADFVSRFLSRHGVEHEIVEHRTTVTAASEAAATGTPPDETAKTLILNDGGAHLLAVIPASERLDLHKLRELLGASRSLRLATEVEIQGAFPDFEVGAVPPVSSTAVASEIVDASLMHADRILCSGGDHEHAIRLDPRQLVELTDARVGDICEA